MTTTTRDQVKWNIEVFRKRPEVLRRMMTSIARKGFLADALLRGGYNALGGVVAYTRNESIYATGDPVDIEELSEYPITSVTGLTPLEERVRKYGFKTVISEEQVKWSALPELNRAMTKMANSMFRYVDGLFMNKVVNDPDIQTMAAAAAWTTTSSTITRDVEYSKAMIRELFEGLEGDTLVIPSAKIPALTANTTFGGAYVGAKAPDNPLFTGQLENLWGMNIMHTPHLPGNNIALLVDRQDIGGFADETPLDVRILPFDEDIDAYWIKARRRVATFLQEPKGVVKITGI
jgi:hypothetical protein